MVFTGVEILCYRGKAWTGKIGRDTAGTQT